MCAVSSPPPAAGASIASPIATPPCSASAAQQGEMEKLRHLLASASIDTDLGDSMNAQKRSSHSRAPTAGPPTPAAPECLFNADTWHSGRAIEILRADPTLAQSASPEGWT